jgi:hypothetical protein
LVLITGLPEQRIFLKKNSQNTTMKNTFFVCNLKFMLEFSQNTKNGQTVNFANSFKNGQMAILFGPVLQATSYYLRLR